MNCRRSGVRPDADTGRAEPSAVARGVSVEETFQPDVDRLPLPGGFGTESSTSSTSFELVDSFVVDAGELAELREAALSVESNGEAKLSVAGTEFGPYTGSLDISIPLEPAVLTAGYQVRAFHRSTDGSSTTTRAQLTLGEV
jgi:hypothetical protein